MATMILTAAGTALGGPVGGAIGALVGRVADGAILARTRRGGPRLGELSVGTSNYGTPIPRLYGTMRVGGSIVWATDIVERLSGGGAKSRGGRTYSYSASFAVLLSARPILGVGRIWADGKLLRGAGGDLKAGGRLRLYTGDADQTADPLIVSAEGAGRAPALRGQAYAVFEDLALADFGNRIPSLTFEVRADADGVTTGAILADASDGWLAAGEDGCGIGGYAAYGELRAVVEGLTAVSGAWAEAGGGGATLRRGAGPVRGLPALTGRRSVAAADAAPGRAAVAHHDPARDWQTGTQVATRPGGGRGVLRIDLPAALSAGAAKAVAADALARADAGRTGRRVSLSWQALDIAPGGRVRIGDEAGTWRVVQQEMGADGVTLDLMPLAEAEAGAAAAAADAGRALAAADVPAGRTTLHAFEIPAIGEAAHAAPVLTIAACGEGAGWRGAAAQISLDAGGRWTPLPDTLRRAVVGRVETAAPPAPSWLEDRAGAVTVALIDLEAGLEDADAAGLDAGANLALVGAELMQFGRAVRLGGGRWRLETLWRGRRGTEWAAAGVRTGDRFVLLDPGTTTEVPLPPSMLGGTVRVMAAGPGDGDAPASAVAEITGGSVAPPAPVHLRREGGTLRWVRRSRGGWRWTDGVDAPLGEERERYRITWPGGEAETAAPLAAVPGDGDATVRQVGTLAVSPTAAR